MKTWFTADLHFGHKNIIKYANRPFTSVEEMNKVMIENWNAVVAPEDEVYIIGDFSFMRVTDTVEILNKLKGKKFLILGNHDTGYLKHESFKGCFEWIRNFSEVKVNGHDLTLCHYAMKVWNKSHFGAWHLYGHSHGTLPDDPKSLSFDVGVDCWNFTPVSFEQVKERMATKTFVPIDHHNAKTNP